MSQKKAVKRQLSTYLTMPWLCFPGEVEDRQLASCGRSEEMDRVV